MNALIVYDSQFGNTERIAQCITSTLSEFGQARAVRVGQVHSEELQGVDMLILGCPTQGMRQTVLQYLDLYGQATQLVGSYFNESSFTTSVDAASAPLSIGVLGV